MSPALLAILASCSDQGVTVYHEPPAINIFKPADGSLYYEQEPIELAAQVETLDNTDVDEIKVSWTAGEKTVCEDTYVPADGIATCVASFDSAGEYKVTATATDPRLDRAADTVTLNIRYNEPPEVTLHAPEDADVLQSSDLVVFQASISDPEDEADQLTVTITSSADGALDVPTDGTTSGDYSGSAYLSPGDHLLTILVMDTAGKTAQDTATVHVNDAPSAPVVEISPDPAGSGELLEAAIITAGVDPEGDLVTYRYDWYVDGALHASGTVPQVATGVTQRGEYWEVQVFPYDGEAYGPAGTDAVSIGNTLPSADSVQLDPTPIYTLDDVICTPIGWDDPEGDTEQYRYRWFVNSFEDSGEATDTYPNGKTTKNDLIQCEATPYDSFGDGDPVLSPTATVENSAPSQPTLVISPASPEPEDTLVCNVTAGSSTDDDGDTISFTYLWVINGSGTSYTSASLDSSATAHNDVIDCQVTPTDGEDSGTYGSDTVTILDVTAPDAVVLDTLGTYRNEEEFSITGTCEANCTLDFYLSDSTGSWTETGTCTSGGAVAHTSYVTRGYETEVYATCEDSAGNVSSNSNTVTTTACDPEDTYENTSGYGDTYGNAIDEWASLADDGSVTITIEGNVLNSTDEDWYLISTTDDNSADLAAGYNDFNLAIELTEGSGTYEFMVYQSSYSSGGQVCNSTGDGYTQFDWDQEDTNDGTSGYDNAPGSDRYCDYSGTEGYNVCSDFSDDWYVEVLRDSSATPSCQHYELTITNGL
ncbi:MAG: hypothetical protein GY913_18050 [Proteobacteria bacterium]|nr:hypothetical protein [Pseudomonadota bacterium]